MLIDTHTHLADEKFKNSSEVINRGYEASVSRMIVPSTSIADLDKVIELVKNHDNLYLLAGIHPEEIETVQDISVMKQELKTRIVGNKKIIGIGEIGLDFFYDKQKKTKNRQVEIFKAQMELAVQLEIPVAIHMREAQEEMMEVLEGMDKRPKGQFHCFAGDKEFLEKVLEWGFYISFAGNITYKSANNLRDRLKEVPQDRLLLETDSPYLAPEPLRGSINEPANVKIIAEFIALELNLTFDEISEFTQKNTICLYSLDTL